ncbi:ferric uptake regulator, Fur family [Desulfonispora thiosulfatigenes DSM 11270]|uniref:Ferric uptake regulator, Fur family n=1 Tax=Desulfonispora thiosulfatigenes DSM 11270 TaxID=656914 RepID=A0A1W1VMF5_DESTI|nr:Fur family transcriptional regulator [Desulfonispora thiosulfatigenes]SMB94559.1 ferric uptake regulator, Fur family [Desulfonispora thiosulfatigenes DSM 11270]
MKHIDDIQKELKAKDYKMTPQRKIIIDFFLKHPEKHLSAEDVFLEVKKINPDIGLATVYRTLELLADLEILKKMNFDDGKFRYEFSNEEEHHHLICLGCDEVIEFENEVLESLANVIAQKHGFKVVDHQLKFYGYCKNCTQKGKDYI